VVEATSPQREAQQVNPQKAREAIESIARGAGAVLLGVADLGEVSDASGEVSLAGLGTGISFAYRLSDVVLEGIVDHPTRTYQYHYRQVNILLDQIGLRIASHIQDLGFKAFPVPSSQIVDWEGLAGHVSHRAIGRLAGHGWIGKNNLLVNPRYGARLRYATVLTDLGLPFDTPLEGDCGSCERCRIACPGGAIGEDHSAFDLDKCIATIDEIRKISNLGSHICGICVKACIGR
jgi:epoxyqueuosine reductase